MSKRRWYVDYDAMAAREVRLVVSVLTDEITDLKAALQKETLEVDRKEKLLQAVQADNKRLRAALDDYVAFNQATGET